MEETSDTCVKLRHAIEDPPTFLPLPESNELIWFSERSGWAHLYLYDLRSGELKHPITAGQWLVREVLHYDAKQRELLVQTAARDPDISPYYRDICKVNIDSGELTPLASGNVDHRVHRYLEATTLASFVIHRCPVGEMHGISPCGQYVVSTRSRVDTVPTSVLIDRNGREILTVETADVSGLPPAWCWPKPAKLKSADGQTDIYAVVFRPPGFSPDNRYPVVEFCTSSRWISAMPQGAFQNNVFAGFAYFHPCALAALGFIVVVIEGRGTPFRHRAFNEYHYGDHRYAGDFDDRIAGIRQLAERYPYMDIERVGLVNTEAMTNGIYALQYSDFYKVAVHHCFYDPRYGYAGLTDAPDGTFNNSPVSNPEDYAASLNGKLLLIVGLLSNTAGATLRVVEALKNANKDFDMLCMPNMGPNLSVYTIRREWDYLVRHLQGTEPPAQFPMESKHDILMKSSEEYKRDYEKSQAFLSGQSQSSCSEELEATTET